MGVIYKLKEDIISFIIDQKKDNPSVGVRTLAAMTSEKFQIKVSKSSVNSVLKNASLSSSVGRRAADTETTAKFTIPPARKKEISKSMLKSGYVKKEAPLMEEGKDEVKEKHEKTGQPFKVSEQGLEKEKIQTDRALHLMPDPLANEPPPPSAPGDEKRGKPDEEREQVPAGGAREDQDFLEHVEHLRRRKCEQRRLVPSGAGFIFLKAAQWEISARSLMAGLFKKHMKGKVSGAFEAASDLFLFLKFLGVETYDAACAYQRHGLWIFDGLDNTVSDGNTNLIDLRTLFQWDNTMQGQPMAGIVLEYGIEKEHAFTEVKGFKVSTEDGTELTIDAPMSTFGGAAAANTAYDLLPVNKAMTRLSNGLISNIQSAVFRKVPGETKFDKTFYDMAAVFENFPGKKILQAAVLNKNGEEIARFLTVPCQKRTFLVGVSPQQREFAELTKTVKWAVKQPFYYQGTDDIVYFTETKTDFMSAQYGGKTGDCRVITIWRDKGYDPFWAVLTNQGRGAGKDILEAYMSRWPYFAGPEQEAATVPNAGRAEKAKNNRKVSEFSSIFTDFVHALHGYCQRHFFPQSYCETDISHVVQSIYGSSGFFYGSKDRITVSLEVSSSSSYRKDLEYAVQRVNEHQICDHYGRRLWLEV